MDFLISKLQGKSIEEMRVYLHQTPYLESIPDDQLNVTGIAVCLLMRKWEISPSYSSKNQLLVESVFGQKLDRNVKIALMYYFDELLAPLTTEINTEPPTNTQTSSRTAYNTRDQVTPFPEQDNELAHTRRQEELISQELVQEREYTFNGSTNNAYPETPRYSAGYYRNATPRNTPQGSLPFTNRTSQLATPCERKRKRDSSEEFNDTPAFKRRRLSDSIVEPSIRTDVVGRNKELDQMLKIVHENLLTAANRPTTIIISGSCGIGKTRLALKVTESKIFNLKLTATISCDLFNDVRSLFTSSFDEKTTVAGAINDWISPHIPRDAIERSFIAVIYLDEIQNMPLQQFELLRVGVHNFAMRERRVVLQLIVSGVAAAFLPADLRSKNEVYAVSVGNMKVFNLRPLNMENSDRLLRAFLEVRGRDPNIADQPTVQQALQWAGGNARLIEFISQKATSNCGFKLLQEQIVDSYENAYGLRLTEQKGLFACLINACISRIPVKLSDVLKSDKYDGTACVRQLVELGIAVFNPKEENTEYYQDNVVGHLSAPLFVLYFFRRKLELL